MREVEERLQAQDKIIMELRAELAEAEEQEEKPKGVGGFLAGVMESQQGQQMFWNVVGAIISKIVPMQNSNGPAAVAGIGNQQADLEGEEMQSVLEVGQPEKVQQAVNVLCTKDPKLGDHLLAVASIAVYDPNKYKFLIGMLR